jgi:hypothetical protein
MGLISGEFLEISQLISDGLGSAPGPDLSSWVGLASVVLSPRPLILTQRPLQASFNETIISPHKSIQIYTTQEVLRQQEQLLEVKEE